MKRYPIMLIHYWDVKPRPPPNPQAAAEKTETLIDDSFSQLPVSDKWLYVDPQYLSKA